MLNLEWFRTFKVIYEAGTLTAAAEALYISQPGVSLHLNSLEAYTGHRLFERDKRSCIPTERATILYNYIIDSMIRLEEIEKLCHHKSRTDKPTISIGMCYATFQQTLEQHIGELPFNLIARFGECRQLITDLNNGAIDFALTSEDTPHPNIVYTPFMTQRIVLISGKYADATPLEEFILSGDRSGIRKWLKQQTWFATSVDMEYLKKFWKANFDVAPDFSPNFILPYFSSVLQSLNNSSGFALVPEFLCYTHRQDHLVNIVCKEYLYMDDTLFSAKRKKTVYAKEVRQIEELIARNWTNDEGPLIKISQ